MMKTVALLKVDMDDRKGRKVLKALVGLPDVDLIALYAKHTRTLTVTVTGEGVDPVAIVHRLRKLCYADILSVGPAIEPNERPVENIPRMIQSYSSSSSEESIRNY